MGRCIRCERELKDSSALYGWRCAQKLGQTQTGTARKSEKWNQMGYRVAYDQANKYLDAIGMDVAEIDLENYYNAFVDLIVAEYWGDIRSWEDAF